MKAKGIRFNLHLAHTDTCYKKGASRARALARNVIGFDGGASDVACGPCLCVFGVFGMKQCFDCHYHDALAWNGSAVSSPHCGCFGSRLRHFLFVIVLGVSCSPLNSSYRRRRRRGCVCAVSCGACAFVPDAFDDLGHCRSH